MFDISLGPVSNRADWSESVELTDEDGAPIDLTGASIVVEMCAAPSDDDYGAHASVGTLVAATVAILDTGVFSFSYTKSQMRSVCPGSYAIGATFERDDETAQLFIGSVAVRSGVVS